MVHGWAGENDTPKDIDMIKKIEAESDHPIY